MMADVVKYGIQIPNRVFVGGIAFDTKEEDLKSFFKQYGKVKDCKIVLDKEGVSRGFGFVTFESKQEATQTQKLGTVFFNQKKLNLGPAIRQKGVVFNDSGEFPAGQDTAPPTASPPPSTGLHYHPSGYCYTVAPDGVWYFHGPSMATGSPTDGAATVTAGVPLQFRAPLVASPPAYEINRPYGGVTATANSHYIANPVIQNGGLPPVSHQLATHPAQSSYTVIENISCQPLPCYPLATSPIYHPQLPPSQLFQLPVLQQEIYRPPLINAPPHSLTTSVTQPTTHIVNPTLPERNATSMGNATMPLNIAPNPVTVLAKGVQSLALNEASYRPQNGLPVVPANQEVCTT